jgi:hypothetical protein
MGENPEMSQIRAVKAKYERKLLRKKNVIGVGIGYRQKNGALTEEVVLTVMVRQKEPQSELRRRDRVPRELDGVPVDVQQVGQPKALKKGG